MEALFDSGLNTFKNASSLQAECKYSLLNSTYECFDVSRAKQL